MTAFWQIVKAFGPTLLQAALIYLGRWMTHAADASAVKAAAGQYGIVEQLWYVHGQWYFGLAVIALGFVWFLYHMTTGVVVRHVSQILTPPSKPQPPADNPALPPDDTLTALAAKHERMVLDLNENDAAIEEWYGIVKTTRAALKKVVK